MKKYVSAAPNVEIIGLGLKAFDLAFSKPDFQPILERFGLTDINPEAWYPVEVTLEIQKAIKDSENGGEQLIDIGVAVIETALFPPLESLDDVFAGFTMQYGMNFRNHSPEERIYSIKLSDDHYQIVNATPHSDEMVYGYVYALVKRFTPPRRHPKVTFDDSTPIDGDGDTIINVVLT